MNRIAWTRLPSLGAIAVAMTIAGCSERLPPVYGVKGQVLLHDGTPLTVPVSVMFESTSPPYARAQGEIDPEGRFELASENRAGFGAMAGEHRVQIYFMDANGFDRRPQLTKLMDPKHFVFGTSDLKFDIKADQVNDITIKLAPPK